MIKDIVQSNENKKVNEEKIIQLKNIIPNCFDKDGKLDIELLKGEFKDTNYVKVRKEKYEQIKKMWELLNKKYIMNYSEFKDEEIENALVKILEEGISSSDEIRTQRELLSVNDSGATIIEMAGLSLATNKKIQYKEFLIKLSDLTNIPITNIHNALVTYNKKHTIDNDFFNSTVLTRFCMEINDWKAGELFERFTYKETELPVHPTSLTTQNGEIKDTIVLGNIGTSKIEGTPQERYLYDTIAYDSEIEKANILEQISQVSVFGKIPKNSIRIPVANGGTYSPDFMYVVDKKDGTSELNLVIESKDVETERSLRNQEIYKIDCAKKLFEQLEKEGKDIKFEKQLSIDKVGTIVKKLIS